MRESEERFRAAFATIPDAINIGRAVDGVNIAVNQGFCRLTGWSEAEAVGVTSASLKLWCDESVRETLLAQLARDGFVRNAEVRFRAKDGSRFIGLVSSQIFRVAGKAHFLTVTQDITERKLAEEALRASEQRFRALISNSSDGVMVIDPQGLSLFSSASVNRLLGEGTEAPGLAILELVHPDDFPRVQEAWAGILAKPDVPVTVVARLKHRDGTFRDFESVVVNRLNDPVVRGVVSNFRDITERRHMEARLMMADRMVSVGTLAAGVAHEINNPLAYMIANLDYVAEKLGGPDREISEALGEVREGAERVRIIVRDLKTFSRGDDVKSGPVELHRVLDASCNLAWNEVRHRARLIKDYSGTLPPVLGNESRLGQVFLNLLINAAQAIPEGAANENQIRIRTHVDGDRVTVEVSDTGAGIAREHLSRLFDPFFTTKPIGVGTGLGLFICRNIVTALGGELTAVSEPGQGTTMRVVLRVTSETVGAEVKPLPPPAVPRGRVLVVDDERFIGLSLVRSLPQHEVVTDTSAQAALVRIRAGAEFDLILCDLMMPETTGMGFFELLEKEWPAQARKVVFMTGGAFTFAARTFLERVANPRLEKPLDLDRIRLLIAERLQAARS